VRWYADAVEDVRRLGSGKVKTWRDPKLGYAQGLLAGVWNEAWAAWSLKDCPVAFRAVKEFLHQSVSDQTAEEAQKEAERQAKLEAERQAKEAALAAAEAQRLRADAERSRKKWLAAGLALALGLAAAMGFAAWSYRQAQQTQEELVSKTKDADAARKQVAIAEAELRETNERRAEVERLLNDNSGRSQADRKRLEDELKQLSDKSSSDKKSMLAAEARLKMESEALAQLRQQATAKDKEYAQAVERAARLERDLKSAQEEIEKLKGRPVPADPKTGEELRQAKLRIEALEKEVRELRAEAVKPAVAIGGRKAGETRVHSDGLTYVWIPPGKFRMGCSPDDSQCDADEKPAHDVTITSGFWISETEVTRQAWRRVVGTDPSSFSGDDRPVEGVSWDEATRYCGAIGGRLPTEAEWEYAARAGATTATYGPLKDVAWYSSNSRRQTPYAATRKPNAWGLYDTLGNVSEWVADWYGPFTDATISDPVGPAKGNSRVVRGGSWSNNPGVVRVSFRSRFVPSVRFSYIGFRCAGEFR
jgi:formylglycine-generating enzyme required for sulfatase activity